MTTGVAAIDVVIVVVLVAVGDFASDLILFEGWGTQIPKKRPEG